MAYATEAQIALAAGGATRLLQIADWDGDGLVDATVIAWAQLTADALIDAHSMMRFAALVDSTAAVVDFAVMLAANEAVYQLRCNRGQASEKDERDAAARLELYRAIAAGTIRPADPLPDASEAPASEWIERDEDGEGVSRTGLEGFW